jgi:ATP-dependent RNA helicase SUPV3L1/SUV3
MSGSAAPLMTASHLTDRAPPEPGAGRIVAVLGPTNTGKTFLAMERMLAHRSGMIGFPLRLLARENYDKVVRQKGRKLVALVTGEEKIIPPGAQYWVCTVESMPLDRPVQFLAVDEIQLCADPERGHIFTDRLLHARGLSETMFLGAETIRPLLQKLVPRLETISRPRFSNLTHAGHKKLARLPPRSAIVAFSVTDVYALAEQVRRSRGGTAVVMGALSPRTRNAQVALYQSGDVDYLVATDAIGMGLNMDVDHVWFARTTKFDGFSPRRLRASEVAQIAGRAGRHLTDGGFGTSWDCEPLDEDTVEAVETHSFPALTQLMWRNGSLDFRSLETLQQSLDVRPPHPVLLRAREADDQLALQILAREPDIAGLARGRSAISLLWEVCQVPDFRKTLTDSHTKLLSQIYQFLRAPAGRLPEDFVAGQVSRLDRVEGDIDTLVARIAHVRTWTYIAHRADWVVDPARWQGVTRGIEDRLSDALHDRLTQRFVDKRSAGLVKSLRDGRELLGSVGRGGAVMVEGHPVGALSGFSFTLDEAVAPEDRKAVMTAARRSLKDEIASRVRQIGAGPPGDFTLAADGTLSWSGAVLGRLTAGPTVLRPAVRVLNDDLLDGTQRDAVRQRLSDWMQGHIRERLGILLALMDADLSGAARGIAFQVAEGLGVLPRSTLAPLLAGLDPAGQRQLTGLGLRLGQSHIFLPRLAKPRALALRALLWAVHADYPLPLTLPPPGRVSVPAADSPGALLAAAGYPVIGPRAIRVDMLDRLERLLAERTTGRTRSGSQNAAGDSTPEGVLSAFADLPALLGCTVDELGGILAALGWRPGTMPDPVTGAGRPIWLRQSERGRSKRISAKSELPGPTAAPDHPFAALARLNRRDQGLG